MSGKVLILVVGMRGIFLAEGREKELILSMEKLTRWEKSMRKSGYQIIPFTHEEIVEHLLQVFERDREHLLMMAAADETKRHELVFVMDHSNIGDQSTIFGGTITYNKKKRRFTHITYSDRRNWAVQFSVESKVAYFSYDFWQPIKKEFPFGASVKRLKEYFLNH